MVMEDLPPVATGFLRLVYFPPEDTRSLTPGMIVGQCAVKPELLNHIQIKRRKVYIDVHNSVSNQVRELLAESGRCLMVENGVDRMSWHFIRIAVGRNHGLNVGLLKKIMKRVEAGPLGKISINNSYSLIGLREDFVKQAIAKLAQQRINGVASQARLAHEREIGKKQAKFDRAPMQSKDLPDRGRPTGHK